MIPLETMKQIFMVDFLQKLLALFWEDNSEMVAEIFVWVLLVMQTFELLGGWLQYR